MTHARIGLALLTAVATAVPVGLAAASPAGAATAGPKASRTSTLEARRVDRVKTPKIDWYDCSAFFLDGDECGTALLPLDYDKPNGPKTEVALLRHKAANPKKRIGSLFVNPGGPGGPAVLVAAQAPLFLSQDVVDRFDIVGFDPRGTWFSDNVRCWPNVGKQLKDLNGLIGLGFPVTGAEQKSWIASSKAWGRACSTTGKPLSGSMSTAEVARDMDVLRRAVGDKKLNFLGFSYGSHIGQVYANLFPDRVRTLVIDGVLDPNGWVGTPKTREVPLDDRLGTGKADVRAMHELLLRCAKAGKDFCQLSGVGDPVSLFDDITARASKAPLKITDPSDPANPIVVTYADIYSELLFDLPDPVLGPFFIDSFLTILANGTLPPIEPDPGTPAASFLKRLRNPHAYAKAQAAKHRPTAKQAKAFGGRALPYDNSPEAFASVLCTDGFHPRKASSWPALAARSAQDAPGFGPLTVWGSSMCASNTWTVRDEDAYRGPWTARTSSPVLVVGSLWDPLTAYEGAVAASHLLPNSRLLSSSNWGHTAYGTNECATTAIDAYLLAKKLPAKGTVCDAPQPYTEPLNPPDGGGSAAATRSATPATAAPRLSSGAAPVPVAPRVPFGIR